MIKRLNLLNQEHVFKFIKKKPNVVIIAAAKVGGVYLIIFMAQISYEIYKFKIFNYASFKNKVKKTYFFGIQLCLSKKSKATIKEKYLLSGKLEETNEPCSSKNCWNKMCQA